MQNSHRQCGPTQHAGSLTASAGDESPKNIQPLSTNSGLLTEMLFGTISTNPGLALLCRYPANVALHLLMIDFKLPDPDCRSGVADSDLFWNFQDDRTWDVRSQ